LIGIHVASYPFVSFEGKERKMEYSKETIRDAKKIIAKSFEEMARERDAIRMAKKMGSDKEGAKEIYHKILSGK
jgi:hypothetical protein